jgi:hypothetical protein
VELVQNLFFIIPLLSALCNLFLLLTFLSAKKVKVTMPEAVTWTLDGEEQKGAHEIEITNLYRSIRLMKKVVKK